MEEVSGIEICELESLLRKNFGDDLKLLRYETKAFVLPGENFCTTLLKVNAIVRRGTKNEDEELNVVAKIRKTTGSLGDFVEEFYVYKKEIFFYEELIPIYQQLEREFGFDEKDIFNAVPKFLGARLSLEDDNEKFDKHAVILLEDLKIQGYNMADKSLGLDLLCAKESVAVLVHFHALGIATRQYKPEIFEFIKTRSNCSEWKEGIFDEPLDIFERQMLNDPELSKHPDIIKAAMSHKSFWLLPFPETWSTMIHGDMWINNFMFHTNSVTGNVDAKLLDFQNYIHHSPLREIVCYLGSSLTDEVLENNFDELLDRYYETFINILKKTKCDIEPFTRIKFDERLKIDAFEIFPFIPLIFKFTNPIGHENFEDLMKFMTDGGLSIVGMNRLRKTFKLFLDKGWLGC